MAFPILAAGTGPLSWASIENAKIGSFSLGGILSALIALVLCLLAVKLVTHLLRKLLQRSRLDERIRKYVLSAIKAVLYVITVIIVVDSLGVPITSLVALLSVCGLALSLAVEDVLGNVAGGLLILATKPFATGDFIEASGVTGTVAEIALHCTKLDTVDGRRVIMPNKGLSGSQLTNYSALGRRRIEHKVTASYDAPLAAVRAALLEAAAATPDILPEPAPAAQVESYGESSIEYSIRCWAGTEHYWDVYYTLLANVKEAFDRSGIEMTYNHLNIHIQNPPVEHGI